MNRRSALRRLGAVGLAGLAGCTGAPTSESGERPRSATPESLQRRVSIPERDDVPEGYGLRIRATVLDGAITDDHTARIRIAVTNEGDKREISVSTGRCAFLNRYGQSSRPRGVWLAVDGDGDGGDYVSETGPQWVAEPPENGAFADYGCGGRQYDSGETVATEYRVFDDARAGGYLEQGTYRFERSVHVESDGESTSFDWGFLLRVANPNCTLCL